ncbi:MAG: hypothetical protein PHD48_11250 [Alphaproteobacteria bacterium]|nr:hypothetical protein [Alphaproteobacteria bacterium]
MEVLFEFKRIGNATKVTAIDVKTGIEISLQAPSSLSKQCLQHNALAKLNYVINKKKKES